MAITPSQIDLWRQEPREHQALEFKEAKSSFNLKKLNQYCVAIANEGGGHLVLGVSDKPPRPVVGSQAFPDPVDTADKLFRAGCFRVDVQAVDHPDGRISSSPFPRDGISVPARRGLPDAVWRDLVPMSEDH